MVPPPMQIKDTVPPLVQKQRDYIEAKNPASPFMTETKIKPIIIKEKPVKILGQVEAEVKEEAVNLKFSTTFKSIKELEKSKRDEDDPFSE